MTPKFVLNIAMPKFEIEIQFGCQSFLASLQKGKIGCKKTYGVQKFLIELAHAKLRKKDFK